VLKIVSSPLIKLSIVLSNYWSLAEVSRPKPKRRLGLPALGGLGAICPVTRFNSGLANLELPKMLDEIRPEYQPQSIGLILPSVGKLCYN